MTMMTVDLHVMDAILAGFSVEMILNCSNCAFHVAFR